MDRANELSDIYVSTNLNTRFLLQIASGTSLDSLKEVLTDLQGQHKKTGIRHICQGLRTSNALPQDGFLYGPGYRLCGEDPAGYNLI